MKKIVLLLVFSTIFSLEALPQSKKEKRTAKFTEIKNLAKSQHFQMEAMDATTQKGRKISLIGRSNDFKMEGEQASADLAYFGAAQSASYGGMDNGILFKGKMIDYSIEVSDKKRKIVIKFRNKSPKETFDIILTLTDSDYATLSIRSNKRNGIRYYGKVQSLE